MILKEVDAKFVECLHCYADNLHHLAFMITNDKERFFDDRFSYVPCPLFFFSFTSSPAPASLIYFPLGVAAVDPVE